MKFFYFEVRRMIVLTRFHFFYDDLQFAYKSKISAIHCVNSVNQTVNHYINNLGKVYVCTLDASKAFDRVNLLTLFKKLFERNMCPLFLRFFIHSYCNQKMRIKWNAAISDSFDTSNGVKQGGVLSPPLFNVYLDELILLLMRTRCWVSHEWHVCWSFLLRR